MRREAPRSVGGGSGKVLSLSPLLIHESLVYEGHGSPSGRAGVLFLCVPKTPSAKPDEFSPPGPGGHPEGGPSLLYGCCPQNDQSTRPVCVALNVLLAGQPPGDHRFGKEISNVRIHTGGGQRRVTAKADPGS